MEVRRSDFPSRLLEILEAISESHFVAIDFEHSGVPVRTFGKQNNVKATLQERYTETKLAAEKYQILQIGLTCVYEDVTNQEYTLQPFNIALSPLIFEKLDFDRDFTFHSGAVEFLNKYGFDYQIPLRDGVPYLSHHEIELIKSRGKTREEERQENDEFSDKSLTNHWLVHSILTKVDLWLKQYPTTDDVLFLGPLELLQANDIDQSLSRLEKRVIHYAVRSEHPRLRTIGRQDGVEIRLFDPERETYYQKKRADELRERINRQKGFGYVIDALAGKNIANIDVRSFTKHPESGRYDCVNRDARARFQRCQALIHNKPKTIVGHNLFLDMIYLYRTFFGELPDTVEEYCEKLHELFPMVVDTKYLATAECGDNMPTSSLQQLATEFGQGQLPIIKVHPDFDKYDSQEANHEAGYDSMITARLVITLSAHLDREDRIKRQKAANWLRSKILNEPYFDVDESATTVTNDLPVLMPSWEDEFWEKYINKLRVFGTQESVCTLMSLKDEGLEPEIEIIW